VRVGCVVRFLFLQWWFNFSFCCTVQSVWIDGFSLFRAHCKFK